MAVDALAASAFALLDKRGSLRFVTDVVHEDDALCLALACRALRDALWACDASRRGRGGSEYNFKILIGLLI